MRQSEHVPGAHGPSHDPRVGGTVAGRYRIAERIAAGGFGAIYRATDVMTGVPVALKVLHHHLITDPAIVARFVREAELLRELQGPQAMVLYASGRTAEGAPYLAMELLGGETLHARFMIRGRLPWREVVTIARGVCGALAEPHALGIVHRDLKPANIFLQARGRLPELVRVLDFGIAKRIEPGVVDGDLTRQGELLGTFDYMAPEQIVGSPATPLADIFTLGVVMYEMIAGVRPFEGDGGQLAALVGGELTPVSARVDVPAALDDVIARCLHPEPTARYATVGQLDAALVQILTDDLERSDTMTSPFALEEDDTWLGDLPFSAETALSTVALFPEPLRARGTNTPPLRFAEGTADDASPLAPTAPYAAVALPVMAAPTLPPVAHVSSRGAHVAIGLLALVLGAAIAFLAVAC
ncbi:MAG: serine/threonine-protein kinase [Kofleriaceae bacterium]|nr:serine/threonine-protein kinase [Kofleriaceae bacterium]